MLIDNAQLCVLEMLLVDKLQRASNESVEEKCLREYYMMYEIQDLLGLQTDRNQKTVPGYWIKLDICLIQ